MLHPNRLFRIIIRVMRDSLGLAPVGFVKAFLVRPSKPGEFFRRQIVDP
jgi:hypothetical protein